MVPDETSLDGCAPSSTGLSHVVLCYASADELVADRTTDVLRRAGLQVRRAPRDRLPETTRLRRIADAVLEAKVVVLLLTEAALTSPSVYRELTLADSAGIPVVPIRLTSRRLPEAMEYFIGGVQWLDASRVGWEAITRQLPSAVLDARRTPRVSDGPGEGGAAHWSPVWGWILLGLFTLGWLAFVPFLVRAARSRRRAAWLEAGAYTSLTIFLFSYFVTVAVNVPHSQLTPADDLAVWTFFVLVSVPQVRLVWLRRGHAAILRRTPPGQPRMTRGWLAVPLLSLGVLSFLPLMVAAARSRRRTLWVEAVVYATTAAGCLAFNMVTTPMEGTTAPVTPVAAVMILLQFSLIGVPTARILWIRNRPWPARR